MVRVIEVIYEDGVFKPLQKIDLPEKTRGQVIIKEKFLEDDIDEIYRRV